MQHSNRGTATTICNDLIFDVLTSKSALVGDEHEVFAEITKPFLVRSVEERRTSHLVSMTQKFSKAWKSFEEFVIFMNEEHANELRDLAASAFHTAFQFKKSVEQITNHQAQTSFSVQEQATDYLKHFGGRNDAKILSDMSDTALKKTPFHCDECRTAVIANFPMFLKKTETQAFNNYAQKRIRLTRRKIIKKDAFFIDMLNSKPRDAQQIVSDAIKETCIAVHIVRHGKKAPKPKKRTLLKVFGGVSIVSTSLAAYQRKKTMELLDWAWIEVSGFFERFWKLITAFT